MKIYTKQGDHGRSVLFDGTRVSKTTSAWETYGIDELNSHLGLIIATCTHATLNSLLTTLQGHLLDLGSDLATLGSPNEAKVRHSPPIVQFLEDQIDSATTPLSATKTLYTSRRQPHRRPPPHRRLPPRRAATSSPSWPTPRPRRRNPLIYLNRLSDLLFTLARLANKLDQTPDIEWHAI